MNILNLFLIFLLYLTYIFNANDEDEKKYENYISNLMKRMAPNTKNDLPKGTQYFIKKHNLIKSTGIELEDDGQLIKLHPDLNGTTADLFTEYPLSLTLKDIKLEIFLNSSLSTKWSSLGNAKFCMSKICGKVQIDEASRFTGTLNNSSLDAILGPLKPNLMVKTKDFSLDDISVAGSLIDVFNSEFSLTGNIGFKIRKDCRLNILLGRTQNITSSDKSVKFQSYLNLELSCLENRPMDLVNEFVDSSFSNYEELQNIEKSSYLMQNIATLVRLTFLFKKQCSVNEDVFECEENKLPLPDFRISIWAPDDRDFTSPSILITFFKGKTEVISKNLANVSDEYPVSPASDLLKILKSFNMTRTKHVAYSSEENYYKTYFDSTENSPCLSIAGLNICKWVGIFKSSSAENDQCSFIKISGTGKVSDDTSLGDTDIIIRPDCEKSKFPKFKMILDVNQLIIQKLLENLGISINTNDEVLKIFDLRNLYHVNSLSSERVSDSLEDFLSSNVPNVINGFSKVPGLNESVPFSMSLDTNNDKLGIKSLCLYLNKLTTLKFIYRLTSLKGKNLPPMLEDSSLCVKTKPNTSLTKNNILLKLPVNVLSKCFSDDMLCPFMNLVADEGGKGIMFEGVLQDTSLRLKTSITPKKTFLQLFNLTDCIINYQIKKPETIKIYMRCLMHLNEITHPLRVYFIPEIKNEKLRILGFVNHKTINYPAFFGLEYFKYKSLSSQFVVSKDIENLIFIADIFYTEYGEESAVQSPKGALMINLKNSNKSKARIVLPPFRIAEIAKVFGYGDCLDLSYLITDTIEEWEIQIDHEKGGNDLNKINGFNFVQNNLFNSTILIYKKSENSKIILRGVKPIFLPIKNTNHQAILTSYSDKNLGPALYINMECACDNTCHMNNIGDILMNIEFLGINGPVRLNLTQATPWEGEFLSNNFLDQSLKAKIFIKIFAFDKNMEFYGFIFELNQILQIKIQNRILTNSKHVIDKTRYFEKELDNILHILNRIRSEKIDLQLKLDEIKKKLEEDTVTKIVYETSLNLTCREETCERICFGCASTLSCMSKDILGSCVSFSHWDMKCGCSRDPLCLLYNDACDEIIELSKNQLRLYEDQKSYQKSLFDIFQKKFEGISKDEAKIELLYQSAIKITLKTMKEMKLMISEANKVIKDIPISKWLKISDVFISSKPEKNETKSRDVCIYIKVDFRNRKNIPTKKYLAYCPSLHGHLLNYLTEEISRDLFPNIYNVSEEEQQFSQDLSDLDKNLKFNSLKNFNATFKKFKLKKMDNSRIRRNTIKETYLKKIVHRTEKAVARDMRPIKNVTEEKEDLTEEDHWMIPHSLKGRCRVFLNVIDIISDLLKIIRQINKYQNKTILQFNKQKNNIILNKNYYLEKLKDSGDLLNLMNSVQNESYQQILTSFSKSVDIYIANMYNGIENVEKDVWSDWKSKLSERIVKMGGKGLDRFMQNLHDVIKTIIKPRESSDSIFSKVKKEHSENILKIVKSMKTAILSKEMNTVEIFYQMNIGYQETKKMKKIVKNSCH